MSLRGFCYLIVIAAVSLATFVAFLMVFLLETALQEGIPHVRLMGYLTVALEGTGLKCRICVSPPVGLYLFLIV